MRPRSPSPLAVLDDHAAHLPPAPHVLLSAAVCRVVFVYGLRARERAGARSCFVFCSACRARLAVSRVVGVGFSRDPLCACVGYCACSCTCARVLARVRVLARARAVNLPPLSSPVPAQIFSANRCPTSFVGVVSAVGLGAPRAPAAVALGLPGGIVAAVGVYASVTLTPLSSRTATVCSSTTANVGALVCLHAGAGGVRAAARCSPCCV